MKLDDLKGTRPAFRVKKDIDLGGDVQQGEFGALWALPKKHEGEDYQLQGSLGVQGKKFPVLGKFTENPGKGQGENDLPAIRLFVDAEGALVEYAVGFKKAGKESGTVYYSGETTGKIGKKASMVFFAVQANEPVPEGSF